MVIAGNHDHLQSTQAQIDYTQKSKRWYFPSLYYSATFSVPGGKTAQLVRMLFLFFVGQSQDMFLRGSVTMQVAIDTVLLLDGDTTQLIWINQTLAASTADYLFVAGHYPVYSGGEHVSFLFLFVHSFVSHLANHITLQIYSFSFTIFFYSCTCPAFSSFYRATLAS
jgi:hypothetical protein